MFTWLAPTAFAALVWWASTGLVLVLVRLPRSAMPRSMAAASALALLALYGLALTADGTEGVDAYLAFVCAVTIWGWHEIAFLCGWLTGPRRRACARHCGGWKHFLHAVEAILWHEIAIIATAALVVAVTWDAPNQTGTLAFLVLWGMRASAKLNLYFGVRNLGEQFLPKRMRYLESFFRRRPMNALFPFSVTLPTALVALAVQSALDPAMPEAQSTGRLLVAALLGLAILEHWMMVLPLPFDRLWQWALRVRRRPAPPHAVAMAAQGASAAAAIDLVALPAGALDAARPRRAENR